MLIGIHLNLYLCIQTFIILVMVKKSFFFLFLFLLLGICVFFFYRRCAGPDAISGATWQWQSGSNNYYAQEKATELKGPDRITVLGEVPNEQVVKLKRIPFRSVAVREARISGDTVNFEGLYRYDGYALCDILSGINVDKLSKDDFYPPVDLYVEIRNDAGEMAVFSWGEIFYSGDMHNIIIAQYVTRVIPGKTGELWALPKTTKLIVGSDRLSERNISAPTSITIRSLKGDYVVDQSRKDPSHSLTFEQADASSVTLDARSPEFAQLTAQIPYNTYTNVLYGHGMGYKGTRSYDGWWLSEIMAPYFEVSAENLRTGMLSVEGLDGYRTAVSFSEVMNRNDQREIILMYAGDQLEEKGREGFSTYAGCDMMVDRAIKGLSKIRMIYAGEDISKKKSNLSGNLILFHAGSLSLPVKAMSDTFMRMHPNVKILSEAAGSLDCARKITELRRPCDIIASADYVVIDKLLIPEYADVNQPFARNEMAVVYTAKSKFAKEINTNNWKEILLRPEVYIGRADPDADPCGYRTLLTLKLANFESQIQAKKNQFMRPKEVDLLALLESGNVDYIFLYKSVAIQHGFPYVSLSDSINLSNNELAQHYASAGVYVRGKSPSDSLYMEGAPMVYSFALLKDAPNPEVARAFADFICDPLGGLSIMKQMGQTPIERQ